MYPDQYEMEDMPGDMGLFSCATVGTSTQISGQHVMGGSTVGDPFDMFYTQNISYK